MSGDAEINSRLNVGEARDRADVSGVRVERARDVYVTTAEGRSGLWVNVPGLRGRFLGREALVQEVVERLTAGESVSLAAHGLPGAGKSTLAARVAHRRDVLAHFKDGVLWAGLGPQGDAARLLGQWALALGEDVSGLAEVGERRQAVKRLIGQRPLLLVIDDAWEAEAAQALRCGGPNCAYLLTTRRQDVARRFAGRENALSVPPLEPDPAETLLQELAPEAWEADPAAVAEIAQRTGRLPLALELVGGYLGAEERSLWPDLAAEALNEMADPERRLQLAARRLGAAGEGQVTLQETMALSVESLPEEARRAFVALGAFAPRPETFTRDAAEAVAEAGAKTLALLVARNLLEMTEEGDLALHQVLGDVAEQETPDAVVARHRDYYLALVNEDREDWRRIEGVYGQIGRAWERAPEDGSLLDLVWALWIFQLRRGLSQDQMKWIQRALNVAWEAGLRKTEGTLLNNLAWVQYRIGQREQALAYYEQALTIREEVQDWPGLGTTLNDIGGVYYSLGRYADALDYYGRALAVREEIKDRSGLAVTMNNIGVALRSLGRNEEALDYYHQALAIHEEIGNRAGLANTLDNIGGFYRSLGRYEEALDYYRRTLAIREEMGDRPKLGTTLNNIGLVYDYLGRQMEALEHYERALAVREEVGDRPGLGTTLNNIAGIRHGRGEYDEALGHYERALAIREEVGDRLGLALTLSNMGTVYNSMDRHEEALAYHERALAIVEEIGDRPGMGVSLFNIGIVYKSLGQYQEALDILGQALAIREEVGDRYGESLTRYSMTWIYWQQGRLREAVDQLRRATELAEVVRSPFQERFAGELAELEAELAESNAG